MASETLDREGASSLTAHPRSPGVAGEPPRWVIPVVASLCFVTLALRTLVALRGGLFRDEAQFLFIVDEPSWASMLDFLRQHESHPPLFYALMRVWVALVGGSDGAALALPVALGGALVPGLYVAGTKLFSWRVGLLGATGAAVSPALVADGSMVRPYSLLPLLTLAATYALVRAIDLGGARRWVVYGVSASALVYTHNWAWLVVAAHSLALAVCLVRGVRRSRPAVLRGAACAGAGVVVGFLPWLPSFLYQSAHAGYTALPLSTNTFGNATVVGYLLATSTLFPVAAGVLGATALLWVLATSALGAFLTRRGATRPPAASHPRTALRVVATTPLAAMGAAVALMPRSNLLVSHCLTMLVPLLLLVIAVGLDRWRALGQVRVSAAASAVLVAVWVVALPPLLQVPRSTSRDVARVVAAEAAPSDLLVIAPWWLASPFNRYYAGANEQIDFPSQGRVTAIPYDDELRRLHDLRALGATEERLTAARAGGRRVWLVAENLNGSCPETTCVDRRLLSDLTRLYGQPVRCETGPARVALRETIRACLFEPS